MNKLRSEYSSFKKLLSITGFGWNPVLKTATTEDASLWDVHVKDNSQWEKFRKSGLPYWEQLVDIFGDVYASGDEAWEMLRHTNFQMEMVIIMAVLLRRPTPYYRQEYQEDEHVLNDELFAPDPVETPNPVLHRQDRTPNAKRRRRSGNADYAMACQAMHDLVKIRQNQYDNNIANSLFAKVNEDPYSIEVAMDALNDMVGLEDEEYKEAN
ncbi:hypothetical protein K1719_031047 [Acacia pycnantha]|nr:hypothetical protein K1719_031047 [Acacia pycnantha]